MKKQEQDHGEARPFRAVSIETKLIAERLAQATVGDIVTYEELSSLAKRDVQMNRGPLHSALRQVLRNRIVFACVAGVGFKRCNDIEKVTVVSYDHLRRMRAAARRSQRAAFAVEDFSSLPRDVQTQHNVQASIAGVVLQMASSNGQKKLRQAVETAGHELPIAATLETFK